MMYAVRLRLLFQLKSFQTKTILQSWAFLKKQKMEWLLERVQSWESALYISKSKDPPEYKLLQVGNRGTFNIKEL